MQNSSYFAAFFNLSDFIFLQNCLHSFCTSGRGILVKTTILFKNMTINLLPLIINTAEEKSVVLSQVQ
jgi:hypothetical protein